MKHIARILIFVMLILQLGNISFASENNKIEVSNGFVKYTVNRNNGRFCIATESGAAYRDDENKPLLFEEYIPDTSFTTFIVDGVEYIYGNNYGFLGTSSWFKKEPDGIGLVSESTWTVKGIEITQTLSLDNSDQNAGNIKISYKVKNTTDQDAFLGSRILLDTMLGHNDGSPVSLPGSQSFIEKETVLSDDEIPMYWKAVDQTFDTNIVSYGLVSGWRNENIISQQDEFYNKKPDKMIIGHWEGLSKTKWDYDINPMLDFTSPNNVYGTRDSAVALYWDEQIFAAGDERIYETYYGLGEYATSQSINPLDFNLFAPERLYLNDTMNGYSSDTVTISGEIDNSLEGSKTLINAKARLEYTTGLSLPYGTLETINLGTVKVDTIRSFSWEMNTSPLYSWTNFKYKVSLSADNLSEIIVRSGDILIPSISGEPPEIKFTDFRPRNLYRLDDEKVLTITGQNLDAITYGGNYQIIIKNTNTGKEYIVKQENITPAKTSISVNIPKSISLDSTGLYEVSVEYIEEGMERRHTLTGLLTLSADKKYMVRKYGILLVIRQDLSDGINYNIVHAKNESELKQLNDFERIILDIRADEIVKTGDVYTITSETATINSIVTLTCDQSLGHDPMTIEKSAKDLGHMDDYVFVTGSGLLGIPGFIFQNGPYEITLVDGTRYSVTDEKDSEGVVIKKPFIYKGVPVFDQISITLQALPLSLNEAILRENSITFGGSINLTALLSAPSKIGAKDEKKKTNETKKENKDEDKDEKGVEGQLKIDDLRFGIWNGNVVLEGLKAEGKIGIPKNITKQIIPSCDLGAELGVSVNTFDNWRFEIKADVNFEVIQAKGNIVFKVFELGGVPIPIPDEITVYGGNKQPGIPLIPPVPVGFLTGLGGGFESLYDTVTLNFNVLPPLTLKAIASFQLFKVFEANEVQLKVSARGATIEVSKIGIGPVKIFENVGMSLDIKDDLTYPGFGMKIYAGLNIMDWVKGQASVLCSVDSAIQSNLGPVIISGEASGSIQIPDDVFIVGGLTFGDAKIGIGNVGVHASMSVIGIPVSFNYNWGGNAAFRAFAGLEPEFQPVKARGIYYAVDYDEHGEECGAVCIGENFHKIDDARLKPSFASLSEEEIFMAAIDSKEHLFDIVDHDYSMIQVNYSGELPDIHLYNPNGDEETLAENQNYITQEAPTGSVDEANKMFISIVNPQNGLWRLTSSGKITAELYKVDAIPELTQVEGQLNGSIMTVDWDGKNIEDENIVNFILCKDKDNDPGTLIATGLSASAGNSTLQLPEDLEEGDYYIRAQLIRGNGDETVLSTLESINTINYVDQHKPHGVTNLSVSNIGSGLLNIIWDNPVADVDGYIVDVIDIETEEPVSYFEFEENTGENIIGGTYNQVDSDMEGNPGVTSNQSGMIPGREYRINVSSFVLVNNIRHYSDPAVENVLLNEPDPAAIEYEVSSEAGQIIDKGIIDEVQTYLTGKRDLSIDLTSNQQVEWEVRVNDEIVYIESSGDISVNVHLLSEESNVNIKAVNSQGDVSQTGFNVLLDEKPPVLRIDSPKQGELADGSIVVNGFVDLNSDLWINGKAVTYDNNGLFNHTLALDNKMLEKIHVKAYDEAGNVSEYYAEVVSIQRWGEGTQKKGTQVIP